MSLLAEIENSVPALRRYAWALLRHRQDADDLVQDCLVRALSRLPGGDVAVRPWLFAILHNLGISRWRSMVRRGRHRPLLDSDLVGGPAQEGGLIARDLLRGLGRLAPEYRAVLLLVGVEGLEYREAAEVLGIPIGTVMSRLSRARDGLRGQMGREAPALRRVK